MYVYKYLIIAFNGQTYFYRYLIQIASAIYNELQKLCLTSKRKTTIDIDID